MPETIPVTPVTMTSADQVALSVAPMWKGQPDSEARYEWTSSDENIVSIGEISDDTLSCAAHTPGLEGTATVTAKEITGKHPYPIETIDITYTQAVEGRSNLSAGAITPEA